jgi:glucosamine--fructose-6-phosphate aminotransferase (isomerizing)
MASGLYTSLEIGSQPAVWQATLDEVASRQEWFFDQLADLARTPFVATGCGSTYYLSLAAAATLRGSGLAAAAAPASELAFFMRQYVPHDRTLLAISRSGTTTETLWAVERYQRERPHGKVVVITCAPDAPLVERAEVCLIAPRAQEQSIAQTRSFTSMALLIQALAAFLTRDAARLERIRRLPSALAELFERAGELPRTIGADLGIQRFFFLGSGPLYGMACEAMLKTKEMSCSWAEAYHTLEFRHGPMAVVDADALVVGMISDSAAEAEIEVLQHMKRLGARTLAIAEAAGAYDWSGVDRVIELRSGLDEWERGALYLPLIQWIAFHRSLAKGLDPDSPVNLTAVVNL